MKANDEPAQANTNKSQAALRVNRFFGVVFNPLVEFQKAEPPENILAKSRKRKKPKMERNDSLPLIKRSVGPKPPQ